MKIDMSRGSCSITFEKGEIHENKRLRLAGELMLNSDGFVFYRNPMKWYYIDNKGLGKTNLVDESDKDEIIAYIQEEAPKYGYKLTYGV